MTIASGRFFDLNDLLCCLSSSSFLAWAGDAGTDGNDTKLDVDVEPNSASSTDVGMNDVDESLLEADCERTEVPASRSTHFLISRFSCNLSIGNFSTELSFASLMYSLKQKMQLICDSNSHFLETRYRFVQDTMYCK